jgi:hypothetical protein
MYNYESWVLMISKCGPAVSSQFGVGRNSSKPNYKKLSPAVASLFFNLTALSKSLSIASFQWRSFRAERCVWISLVVIHFMFLKPLNIHLACG